MKLSIEWLKDYVRLTPELSPKQIQHDLTMVTVEVEQVTELARLLDRVVVGQVQTVSPHPKSQRLRLARCDLGNGLTEELVCGGSNLQVGQKVAVALPGARVRPKGEATPIEIKPAVVHGVPSAGMLCSAAELGLTDLFPPGGDHEIIDLAGIECSAGQPLAAAIGYDDTVIQIDNKSLTNRPDLWGHYGIARELAAIYDLPLAPLPRFDAPAIEDGLNARIDNPAQCRRYTATRVKYVSNGASPFWLRSRLARVGQRPINVLVDLTNYVMLAVGQPTHAFDASLVRGAIEVRSSRVNETIELLDGTNLDLDTGTLLIADQAGPVALAGVMGGKRSSVLPNSSELILEVAQFERGEVRRTMTRYGVRTESSTRYEKALDPNLVDAGLGVFFDVLARIDPAATATGHIDAHPRKLEPGQLGVGVEWLRRRLGKDLPDDEIRHTLERLGFGVRIENGRLELLVPTWRCTGDISAPEDVLEEVARLYGYNRLDFVPPNVKLVSPVHQPRVRLERELREYLARTCGMQELMSYPWVEDRYWDAAGLEDSRAFALAVPPAPNSRRLRTSLVPSLLRAVALNLRFRQEMAIFELSRVFLGEDLVRVSDDREKLPRQPKRVSGALVGKDSGRLFLIAKGILEHMGTAVQMEPLTLISGTTSNAAWADPVANLLVRVGDAPAGVVGVVSPQTLRKADIRNARAVIFEIDVEALRAKASRENRFVALPEFPQVSYDLNEVFDVAVRWNAVKAAAASAHALVQQVEFVDEYHGQQVPAGKKSLTLRLTLGSDKGTLTSQQIEEAAGAVVRRLHEELGGTIRAT